MADFDALSAPAMGALITLHPDSKSRFAALGSQVNLARTGAAQAVGLTTLQGNSASLAAGFSFDDLASVGQDFFNRLSQSAFDVVCGSADGSTQVNTVVNQGEQAVASTIAALLVANLGLIAAIAAPLASVVVNLFFKAGIGLACSEWKASLPASHTAPPTDVTPPAAQTQPANATA